MSAELYWLILPALFLVLEAYGLAFNHIPALRKRFPRAPKIGTLSQAIWWCDGKAPRVTAAAIACLFTGLTFHFLLTGWCAP